MGVGRDSDILSSALEAHRHVASSGGSLLSSHVALFLKEERAQ